MMIYLGTDFCPNGWNTHNGEFSWNEKAFPNPKQMVQQLHDLNFKVVLHTVVEGRWHFHQVMGFALVTRAEQNRGQLEAIIASFREGR